MPTGGTGFCGLWWQQLADGRLLMIAYEHPDNPGRSLTNTAKEIAGHRAPGGRPVRLDLAHWEQASVRW